ncbi:hypothetical protein V6N12_068413 [Hibiscus sabdariffa]|uniref:Glycine-rich RNA-binding protein RZ1A n=1 Tax=Hibiscus sabdariffa TaxID=183260 RepID=A0ABR2FQE5_9ROSI
MTEDVEYRCFIGNLSWSTSDRGLKDAFEKFGNLIEAKVAVDKISGRSRGFGFVSFDEKAAMEEAIEAMNGMDLDGRNITVDRAKPQQGSGRDYDGDRNRDRGRDRDHDRSRGYDGGRGSNGGECFKCGKPGHFARECPSDGARGGKYGGRGDRYGGGMQAVVGGLEVIDTVVIVLDHMSVVELELLVLDKTAACADEPVNKQESSGMLGPFVIFMDTLLGYFVANWTWFYKL